MTQQRKIAAASTAKAAEKIADQESAVRKLDGSAILHPPQMQLLNDTRGH